VIELKNVHKTYHGGVQALRGVDLIVPPKTTVALVGESGCGKSTLAKILIGLEKPSQGEMFLDGKSLLEMSARERAKYIQMIFQDPGSSLNPRKQVYDIIAEPLVVQGAPDDAIKKKVFSLMEAVGLRSEMAKRYPHMFSGGQKQRIGIARALVTDPRYIICDEPVSALDVSVQAQVLNLLAELQKDRGLSLLFISHDLSVVKFISRHLAVMYLGKIVEENETAQVFKKPLHPYTQMLLQSLPTIYKKALDSDLKALELPSPINPPEGCAFNPRCPYVQDVCKIEVPPLISRKGGKAACHFADVLDLSKGLE
jgi:oligopeptide/dipeptide ABC transporter ATP-binding protein